MDNSTEERAQSSESLAELIAGARRQMEEAGYTPSTRRRYGDVWGSLRSFARKVENTDRFSIELTERFLLRRYPPDICHPMPPRLQQDLAALRLLTEFHVRGHIKPRRYPDRRLSLPVHFQEVLAEYERHCVAAGQRPTTLKGRRQQMTTFLLFLNDVGIEHLSEICPPHVSDFISLSAITLPAW